MTCNAAGIGVGGASPTFVESAYTVEPLHSCEPLLMKPWTCAVRLISRNRTSFAKLEGDRLDAGLSSLECGQDSVVLDLVRKDDMTRQTRDE